MGTSSSSQNDEKTGPDEKVNDEKTEEQNTYDYFNQFPTDIKKHMIYSFLKPVTCDDYARDGYCKGIDSFYFDEDEKKEKDCVRFCLANCKPNDLLPLLDFPKEVMVKFRNGTKKRTNVLGFQIIIKNMIYNIKVNKTINGEYHIDTEYPTNSQPRTRIISNIHEASSILCDKLKTLLSTRWATEPTLSCILHIDTKGLNKHIRQLRFIGPDYIRPSSFWKMSRFRSIFFEIEIPIGVSE